MHKIKNIFFIIIAAICIGGNISYAADEHAPVYGSWTPIFTDNFDGSPTAYNGDSNFDAGLVSNGWQFSSGANAAVSTKRTGDGRVQIICNPNIYAWLTTDQYFPCDIDTEFFVKQCDTDQINQLFQRIRLMDSTGDYQMGVFFRRSDKLFQFFVTEGGVTRQIFAQTPMAYTNVPSISIIVSKKTIDVCFNRTTRADLNGPTTPGYSYAHNIPESVINAGFRLQLFCKGDSSAQTTTYYEEAAVSRRPASASTVNINVSSQVVKSGLDSNDYCAINWEAMASRPHLRTIFNNPSHYEAFKTFLDSEYPVKTFRYPGGVDVLWLHFGVSDSSLQTAAQKQGAGYAPDYINNLINIEEFFQFLVDSNSQCILQVNSLTWFDTIANEIKWLNADGSGNFGGTLNTTALAAAADAVEDMAQWIVSNNYQSRVRYWEIGNEDYFVFTASQYATVASAMINKIKGVLPSAKIIVTNQIGAEGSEAAWRNAWTTTVNQDLVTLGQANNIFGVTHHNYTFAIKDYSSDAPAYQEFAAYTSFWPNDPDRQTGAYYDSFSNTTTLIGKHLDILSATGLGNAKLFWTEFRQGGMLEKHNKAISGALGNLHLNAGLLTANGLNCTVFHGGLFHANYVSQAQSLPFDGWGFNSIYYQADEDMTPRIVSSPLSEVQKILSKLANGDVLQSTASKSRILSVATKQNETLRVLVMNEYAKPDNDSDTASTLWSILVSDEMTSLASDSASGDAFDLLLNLPSGINLESYVVKAYKFGDLERLHTDSVDTVHYTHHEIKLQEEYVQGTGSTLEYKLTPSSAVLFELSPLTCENVQHLAADLNKDCRIDFADLAEFASDWLKCNKPNQQGCTNTW
ncbi:MAG: hypothetical protein A2Y12_18240 [Planctomycetes bacterium GWF2_42_9]|nr:MAG: hypothetical protein A2Y12_18240 [Planctomycetes bacterium GWF2_42_9]